MNNGRRSGDFLAGSLLRRVGQAKRRRVGTDEKPDDGDRASSDRKKGGIQFQ